MRGYFLSGLIQRILVWKGKRSLATIEKNSRDAMGINQKRLMEILRKNQNTEYGKKYHFDQIHSVEDYIKQVPLTEYDTYEPYIERMTQGEKKLITAYPVELYALTSGSAGKAKMIPVTQNALAMYSKYSLPRAMALVAKCCKKSGRKLYRERSLITMEIRTQYVSDGTPQEFISSAISRIYRPIYRFTATSPMPVLLPQGNMNMLYMKARFALENPSLSCMVGIFMSNFTDVMDYIKNNWKMLTDDIENGIVNDSMCDDATKKKLAPYLKKNPKRAKELRRVFEEGFDTPIATKIWKHLSWLSAVGTAGFASQTEKMRTYVGDLPMDFSLLSPSEGMIAAAMCVNEERFILLPESCFYEFIPVSEDGSSETTLTLDQLEVGKEYEVILTTEGGLYRYQLRDVIRVLDYKNTCPVIKFVYRKNVIANVASEKTTIEQFDAAVQKMSNALGCCIYDYCVYIDLQSSPGRYVILIEPDQEIDTDEERLNRMMDTYLCEANPKEYDGFRGNNSIGEPSVLIQTPGTHALWRMKKMEEGLSSAQIKPVRLLDTEEKKSFFMSRIKE